MPLSKKEAKKQEKLKAEAKLRNKLKQQELQREMTAQAAIRDEVDRTWREIIIKIKEPVFRQDIEVMWHVFERTIDKKDNLIKYTVKLINLADDQVSRTISSFCVTLDTMITKFLKDLDELGKDNVARTKALIKLGEQEVNKIMDHHNAAETHLKLLLYHGHTTADSDLWTTRGENLVKQDEEKNKNLNERERLRSLLESIYNTIWDDYKMVLRAYVTETADIQKQVRKLRRKDNLMGDIIASQGKRIAGNDNVLKRLRSELQQYESGTKQAVFRERRDRYRAACHKLKFKLVNGCDLDVQQLANLVRYSDDAFEWLQASRKKGEKILRIASICRRLETQREKVLPFGCQLPHEPIEIDIKNNKQSIEDLLVNNAITSTTGLNRLWQRIAKAELSRKALCREKILLMKENNFLVNHMKKSNGNNNALKAVDCICTTKIEDATVHRPIAIDGPQSIKYYNFK